MFVVTGAGGYLGARVATMLPSARALKRADTDLRDVDAVRAAIPQGAVIVHCAAQVPRSAEAYGDDEAAEGNLAMVRALVGVRPRLVVFASSMTVYDGSHGHAVREEDAGGDLQPYAKTKLAAEQELAMSGIPFTAVRLPGLFGSPRRSGLLYNVAWAYGTGKFPTLGSSFPHWAALHVDDAAEIMARIARAGLALGPVNAGYGGWFSIPDAVRRLARLASLETPELPDAPRFAMDLSRLAAAIDLPTHTFDERLAELMAWAAQ